MKRKTKSILTLLLSLVLLIQSAAFYSVSAAEESAYDKMVQIAKQEVGYLETTYPDGTFSSKYGEWYGIPNGAWCAMFCSWCANQAGISTEVLPKFASCHVGMQWFQDKNLWKEGTGYIPVPGDLVFLNDCTHVGIVEKYDDGIVYTIEGNACDDNQENYGVRKRFYAASSAKITGYGLPDKSIISKFKGKAVKKETAYMLPDTSSQTVWEVWENDDLEILCKDGDFYLVMYPFLSTGKFVCAYVPENAVSTSADIPDAVDFYRSRQAFFNADTALYHNPSDAPLMSSTGVDKKVRAEVKEFDNCQILFEKDGYYFIKTEEGITGFTYPSKVEVLTESNLLFGDVNFDGKINEDDITIITDYLVGQRTSICKIVADVNLDNAVNVNDVNYLLRTNSGRYLENHVGKPLREVFNLLGDADKDGNITENDVRFLLQSITKGNNAVELKQGDANFDKKLSVLDGRVIAKYVGDNTSNEYVGKPTADFYTILGDINGDGVVTNDDAAKLSDAISNNSTMTLKKEKAADVNFDNRVSVDDVNAINQFANGQSINEHIGTEICVFDEFGEPQKPDTNLCGDLDRNNKVTIEDATLLQQYLAEMISAQSLQLTMADTLADGRITIRDVTEIQRFVAELIDHLPSGQTEPADIPVESLLLPESIQLTIGDSARVACQILPENATNKNLFWMSADESIATVTDDGIITGHEIGTTKVFAISSNGIRQSTNIIVVSRTIPVTGISISNSAPAPVYSGTGIQLNATVLPGDATDKSIEWTSSNPDVASVDGNGYVTTKTAGTVTIIATSSDKSIKATATVRINQMLTYLNNGYYSFKLKGTNSYLDHQGGNANGTNVHLWEGDGYSNNNQKIKIERIDDNRYMLWSACSDNLMLDVNRGNSYNAPLKVGLNVDLWENNDWQAQEWLFTKTYDGYYIIRLNMLQEGALEASGKNNGDNIFFGSFNSENDMQKWELMGTPIPVLDDPLEAKFRELQNRFRSGEYWNHYNASDYSHTGTIPCHCSNTCAPSCSCECGQFYYNGNWVAGQCHGYVLRLAYEIYGNNANTWTTNTSIDSVRAGDIIRFWNDGHSVMVTKVSGEYITFTDCNRAGPCKVAWNVTQHKSWFTGLTKIYKHP